MNKQFTLGAIVIMISLALITMIGTRVVQQRVLSATEQTFEQSFTQRKAAPIATSGDNVYIAWWTNKTGNDEAMLRASTDGGKAFGDKINLSNSTKSESQDVQIAASGDRVFVTWWERNATSNEPVARVSTDNGKTFGQIMKMSTNGTVGSSGAG